VTIRFRNEMVGIFLDRFGKDVTIIPQNNDYSTVHVKVAVSRSFYGWLLGLGPNVTLVGPESAVSEMREMLRDGAQQYMSI